MLRDRRKRVLPRYQGGTLQCHPRRCEVDYVSRNGDPFAAANVQPRETVGGVEERGVAVYVELLNANVGRPGARTLLLPDGCWRRSRAVGLQDRLAEALSIRVRLPYG